MSLKINPITGKMDLVRNISDDPTHNQNEESASTKATKTLSDQIAAEAAARAAADTAETNARTAADTAETNARTAADTAEANARSTADTALTNALNAEITARSNADTVETNARTAADNALSDRITNIFRSALEEENFFSYGVIFDTQISAPNISRIGNASLHRELPIQSNIKACLLLDNGNVNYYLNPSDWTKKMDGSASDLTGSHGQVMIELPSYYIKFETVGTLKKVKISAYNLPGFTYVPKKYIGAYEASLQRSTLKLCSVVNNSADYRGGNNNAAWDAETRTLLGRPATAISRIDFRTYARNRGSVNWNILTYEAYKSLFWLYTIEYANLNSQAAINAALDSNGFKQGGLGNGVTDIDGTKWNTWNTYYPFIPCGQTNSLASGTGELTFSMPAEYDAVIKTTKVNRYRGIEMPFGHIWKWVDGVNIRIQADSAGALSQAYTCADPALFSNIDYAGYTLRGNLSRVEGYIKEMLFGNNGDILPSIVGGGSTTWWCDYFYTSLPANGEAIRGVLFSGSASNGSNAGLGYSFTYYAPSSTNAYIGSRLCFLGA